MTIWIIKLRAFNRKVACVWAYDARQARIKARHFFNYPRTERLIAEMAYNNDTTSAPDRV